MLQTTTVEKQTFELLKRLMQDKFLSNFLLAVKNKTFDWKKIEKRIIEMIAFENKIFNHYPV
jgi:hypothetical protein